MICQHTLKEQVNSGSFWRVTNIYLPRRQNVVRNGVYKQHFMPPRIQVRISPKHPIYLIQWFHTLIKEGGGRAHMFGRSHHLWHHRRRKNGWQYQYGTAEANWVLLIQQNLLVYLNSASWLKRGVECVSFITPSICVLLNLVNSS